MFNFKFKLLNIYVNICVKFDSTKNTFCSILNLDLRDRIPVMCNIWQCVLLHFIGQHSIVYALRCWNVYVTRQNLKFMLEFGVQTMLGDAKLTFRAVLLSTVCFIDNVSLCKS